MLTIERAAEYGQALERAFDDVKVDGTREPIVVKAKGHNKFRHTTLMTCEHKRHRRSKNITAGMTVERGRRYLCKGGESRIPLREFESVTTCAQCDLVLDYEEV